MNVGFLVFDKALITGVSLAAEMMLSASKLRSRQQIKKDPLEVKVVGICEALAQSAGVTLQPDVLMDDCEQLDLLILPPLWGNPFPVMARAPKVAPWLVSQYTGGASIMATGTGVCWLAESGLLDGQVATTHWYFFEKFRRYYPSVSLNSQASITESNGLYCTGSINSQTEMVLYFIRLWYGEKIVGVIEKHFSHEISFSDQQPFYQVGGGMQFDEAIAQVLDWIKRELSREITAANMAQVANMSLRTFNRKFKQQVGLTPNHYLQKIRMEEAKVLLRDPGLNQTDVAQLIGYRDTHHFSRKFSQFFQLRPRQYRQMVRAKQFNTMG